MSERIYDIVLIGGGLSSTSTLINILEQLVEQNYNQTLNILIIEKNEQLFKGFVYGDIGGYDSLIITPLNKFIFDDDYKYFIEWLIQYKSDWLFKYSIKSPEGFKKWYEVNQSSIENNNFENIFLPRFIYGDFLEFRVVKIIKQAQKIFKLTVNHHFSEVVDINNNSCNFKIKCKDSLEYFSKRIILGIGSPPYRSLKKYIEIQDSTTLFIDKQYNPTITLNVKNIIDKLKSEKFKEKNNIIIIGSNATCIELLYLLYLNPIFLAEINKIFILSPMGSLPQLLENFDSKNNRDYAFLNQLILHEKVYAYEIVKTLQKELKGISNNSEALYYDTLMERIITIFTKLNEKEKKKFVSKYGLQIVRLIRRVGVEHYRSINCFIENNKIEFIKGKLISCINTDNNKFQISYKTNNGKIKKENITLQSIINSTGFENIDNTTSILIKNLIKNKIFTVNKSKKGFELDENFQSNNVENIFVMGPLITGHYSENIKLWHAESNSRILALSKKLANFISSHLLLEESF